MQPGEWGLLAALRAIGQNAVADDYVAHLQTIIMVIDAVKDNLIIFFGTSLLRCIWMFISINSWSLDCVACMSTKYIKNINVCYFDY